MVQKKLKAIFGLKKYNVNNNNNNNNMINEIKLTEPNIRNKQKLFFILSILTLFVIIKIIFSAITIINVVRVIPFFLIFITLSYIALKLSEAKISDNRIITKTLFFSENCFDINDITSMKRIQGLFILIKYKVENQNKSLLLIYTKRTSKMPYAYGIIKEKLKKIQ